MIHMREHISKDGGAVLMPWSDAKNAFDLVMDTVQAILDEPRRYNQELWRSRDKRDIDSRLNPKIYRDEKCEELVPVYPEELEPPTCGTVACRAGWLVTLAGRVSVNETGDSVFDYGARDLLGYPKDWCLKATSLEESEFARDVNSLFNGTALDRETGSSDLPRVGSPEYARLGADGLIRFAEKWKDRLLATPVA